MLPSLRSISSQFIFLADVLQCCFIAVLFILFSSKVEFNQFKNDYSNFFKNRSQFKEKDFGIQ